MKSIKKVFIIVVAAMCCLTAVVLSAKQVFGIMRDDGYAVPVSAGITAGFEAEEHQPIPLVEVDYEDVVYSTPGGYRVERACCFTFKISESFS